MTLLLGESHWQDVSVPDVGVRVGACACVHTRGLLQHTRFSVNGSSLPEGGSCPGPRDSVRQSSRAGLAAGDASLPQSACKASGPGEVPC